VPWCPADLLLCSAPLLLCCMDSFLLCLSAACQQRKHLTSRFFDPLHFPPLPSLLSFTRQFHFYAAFSLVRPCRPTAAKLALILASLLHGPWPPPTALPAAGGELSSQASSQVVYFRGPSQFVMRPPIGCGPGPLLGSHARPACIPDACKPCIRGEFKPLRVNPLPYRTMSLGEPGSCRARGKRGSCERRTEMRQRT
jgi:hypothetical protein